MNVGHTNITLNSQQHQSSAAASLKSGHLATSQSSAPPQSTASDLSASETQRPDNGLAISRINDPLNPNQIQRPDNRGQQPRTAQSATTPASEPTSRLQAESIQSEQQVQAQVRQLAQLDREVRNHEAAHAAAGGGLTGAPSYSYTRGPDGQLYATAGEVDINTSRSTDPETDVQNARTVLQAALAPANPSSQDLRVAAQARAQLIDAQAELNRNDEQAAAALRSKPVAEDADVAQSAQALATENEKQDQEPQKLEPKDDGFQQVQDEFQQRQARIQQKQLEFAQEMAGINLRIQLVQQQLIETGQVDPGSLLQGTLVDTQV